MMVIVKDISAFPVLLIELFFFWRSGSLIAEALFKEWPIRRKIPAAFVFSLVLSALLVILTGNLGILTPISILAFAGASFLLVRHITGKIRRTESASKRTPISIRNKSGESSSIVSPGNGSLFHSRLPDIQALFFIAFISLIIISALAERMDDGPGGWDAFTYHLEFPAFWLQSRHFENPIQHCGDQGPPFYPMNGEIWTFLLMAPFGDDFAARFVQLPFLLIALMCLYNIAELIEIPHKSRLFVVFIFALTPMVPGMTTIAFNDLILASLFCLAFFWILMSWKYPSFPSVLTAGLALGLFLGTKYNALLYSLPLMVILTAVIIFKCRSRLKSAIVVCLAVITGGGFTYLRNWIITGDPVYPVHLELFGKVLLEGIYSVNLFDSYGFHQIDFDVLFFGAPAFETVGHQVAWLLIPVLPFAFIAAAFKAMRNRKGLPLLVIPMPLILFALFYFKMPYRYHPRFILPAIAIAALSPVYLFHSLPRFPASALLTLICTIIILINPFPLFANKAVILMICLPAAVILYFTPYFPVTLNKPLLTAQTFIKKWKKILVATILILSAGFGPVLLSRYRDGKWDHLEGEFGHAARWLYENSRSESFKIAYSGTNGPYPFRGFRLNNPLYFVPRNKTIDSHIYGFGRSFENPGEPQNKSAWLKNLKKMRIQRLLTASEIKGTFPAEDKWADEQGFLRVYSSHHYHIYDCTSYSENALQSGENDRDDKTRPRQIIRLKEK